MRYDSCIGDAIVSSWQESIPSVIGGNLSSRSHTFEERLLVVAFKFPPYDQVGARRWAKLAKYLARAGVEIDVLTVRWPESERSLAADVKSPRIHVHRLPSLGPHKMRHRRHADSRAGRLLARVNAGVWRRIRSRSFSEDARYWGWVMLPYAAALVRGKRIRTVVVTGAPFMANYWASFLKRLAPGIRLVQEFRDPWYDLPSVAALPMKEREAVKRRERRAFESADLLVSVSNGLTELLRSSCPSDVETLVVTNGYDREDAQAGAHTNRLRDPVILYAGNALVGRERPLEAILEAMRDADADIGPLRLRMFGRWSARIEEDFADLVASGRLELREPVSAGEIAQEIERSFACLHLNAERFPYALSTKVFEYAVARRPIVSVNYGGEAAELIRTHDLGWSVDARKPQEIRSMLRELAELSASNPQYETRPTGIEQYDMKTVAEHYRTALFSEMEPPPGE